MDFFERLSGYFSDHPGIQLAVLFGSNARGDAHAASDIDIGICFDYHPDMLELGGIVATLTDLTGKRVDLLELEGLPVKNPLLAYTVAVEGRLLAENRPDAWLAYRNRACIQYFDMQEFLERQHSELNRRLQAGEFGKPVHA
jgi:uncharacterized protein